MTLDQLLLKASGQVWATLLHNWPFLMVSVLVGVVIKLYVNQDAVATFLRRFQKGGVLAATAAAVATPLCSCGTTAVILGMMAGSMPWAPIIAFMVASPLTSPEELVYSAGLFGWPFALAFFAASIVLGLLGGLTAIMLDSRGWLAHQSRFAPSEPSMPVQLSHAERQTPRQPVEASCGCGVAQNPATALPLFVVAQSCACSADAPVPSIPLLPKTASACCSTGTQTYFASATLDMGVGSPEPATRGQTLNVRVLLRETYLTGSRLLGFFVAFAFAGYLLNDLIPAAWIPALFGGGRAYSVPLAATLGLPFYINTEASLPLVRAMLDAGMSSGAALAFLITGAGTSIGAVAGALTIARWRVVGLVIATLWVGAILCGFGYDALMAAHWF